MKTISATKRLLGITLMVCMMLTMLPVFAAGEVEITSPAYGGVVEVGEATKIRVASAAEPTVTAGADSLTVVSAGEGIWDAAWTPPAVGNVAITATAGDVSDTVRVYAAPMTSKIAVASDFAAAHTFEEHWFGVQGTATLNSDEGYSTIALNGTHAHVQYTTKNTYGPEHGAVVWEADLRLPTDGNSLYLKHRNDTGVYEDLFILSPTQGTLYVANDPMNNWKKRVEPETWFNLKTVFDMDAQTYTIYIDDIAVSVDNALPTLAAQGIDGLFLQMQWYSTDSVSSFDIKNYALRHEVERSLTITSPKAGSLQETGYRMPVRLTASGMLDGDVITVTGSDGAEATAALIEGTTDQYIAYLVPNSASDTYSLSASLAGGGRAVAADAVAVKTADTMQLGAWDFNDTSKVAGVTEASDNFYAAQKTISGDSVAWVGGIGGKAEDDLAYQLTDASTANNTATALSFWPQGSAVYSTLILEFDYYYTGNQFAISTSSSPVSGEIYITKNSTIQFPKTWENVGTIAMNQWHHIKAVFDKTNNAFDFYMNGEHLFQRSGTYDAATNPNGVAQDVANNTVWMGCPAYGSGVNTVDNISIRALASDSSLAKKTSAMSVGTIGAIKPNDTITVNATLPLMSESATAYINGVKNADILTKNADGYYQSTITAPAEAGEMELTVVDNYGATATQTVTIKNPDAAFDFSTAANNGTGWKSGQWMIWPTNMEWTEESGKLTSASGAVGSETIQINDYPTTGMIVIDFDATIPATGNITAKTRQAAGNEPALGYIQAGNTGYNDPNTKTWVANKNVVEGEQNFRYICDIDAQTLTLYIDGDLIFSYVNPNITQFNALSLAASAATVTNTLDNVEAYYLAPETETIAADGVSNVTFTTGRDMEFATENLSGIRRIRFSADISATSDEALRVIIAAYDATANDGVTLIGANVIEQNVSAGTTTPITAELNLSEGLSSGAELKVFIWRNDGTMTPFSGAKIP